MKLCTVIAYYITSITKQLKFLNSHCSIVCSYCAVVCLIAESELKNDWISSSFKLNEVQKLIALSKRIPKIYFFQGGPNFGGETAENFFGK